MKYTLARDPNGCWRAYHQGRTFAYAGTFCRLMDMTRNRNTR